jgi:hypothetical protein
MKLTYENYANVVSNLSYDQRVFFYETLAHHLTVAARIIWANENLNDKDKVEQMKSLNEVQHRIVRKIQVERLQIHEWKEDDIIKVIKGCAQNHPGLEKDILWAINSGFEKTIKNETLNN